MRTAEIAFWVALAVVAVPACVVVWGALTARWLGVKPVRLTAHPGRHVSTERVYAGGRYYGTQPRRYALPLTEQEIERVHAGDAPWEKVTAAQPMLTDAYTLEMYRGEHGVRPHREAAEADQLAEAMRP